MWNGGSRADDHWWRWVVCYSKFGSTATGSQLLTDLAIVPTVVPGFRLDCCYPPYTNKVTSLGPTNLSSYLRFCSLISTIQIHEKPSWAFKIYSLGPWCVSFASQTFTYYSPQISVVPTHHHHQLFNVSCLQVDFATTWSISKLIPYLSSFHFVRQLKVGAVHLWVGSHLKNDFFFARHYCAYVEFFLICHILAKTWIISRSAFFSANDTPLMSLTHLHSFTIIDAALWPLPPWHHSCPLEPIWADR